MSNRIKPNALKTREEFVAAVNNAADFQSQIDYINARRDRAIQRIQLRFGALTAPLELKRDAHATLAEAYAEAHRAELLPDEKKKKSADTSAATFGWRVGNPTVRLTSKKVTEEMAIEKLKELRLGSYVRQKEELAKDKILRDADTEEQTLQRAVQDPAGNSVMRDGEPVMEPVKLADAGLKITQAESFYIEPKIETSAAIKVEAAA